MKIDFNSVSTIVFDLGGVLVNLDKPRCVANFEKIGIHVMEDLLSLTHQRGFIMDFELGLISDAEFRNKLRSYSEIKPTDEQINQAWNSFLVDIPNEKLALLKKLKGKFKILMLSNTNVLSFNYTVDTMFQANGNKLEDYFDKCYLSYELHKAKPSSEIFEYLLQDAGVKAENCLFIDDGESNIKAAESLGFKTYFAKTHEDLTPVFQDVI